MNKKGQSLPLNTLIIIILVVIVLIVVAVFFLGGTSSLSRSIRNIFYGTTAGTDLTLAREICEQRCESLQGSTSDQQAKRSAYCTATFDIDIGNDGKVDGDDLGKRCSEEPIGHICNLRIAPSPPAVGSTQRVVC